MAPSLIVARQLTTLIEGEKVPLVSATSPSQPRLIAQGSGLNDCMGWAGHTEMLAWTGRDLYTLRVQTVAIY